MPFLTVFDAQAVARALVAAVADEDLVERVKDLAVVELGFDQRQLVDRRAVLLDEREDAAELRAREAHERAFDVVRVGIDADHRLAVEIFRDVRDQAVLSDRHDDVLGRKRERCEIATVETSAAPIDGDAFEDVRDGEPLQLVAAHRLVEPAGPVLREKAGLLARAVLLDEQLEVAGPRDDHDARREYRRHRYASALDGFCANALAIDVRRSGVICRFAIELMCSANAVAATVARTDPGACCSASSRLASTR